MPFTIVPPSVPPRIIILLVVLIRLRHEPISLGSLIPVLPGVKNMQTGLVLWHVGHLLANALDLFRHFDN